MKYFTITELTASKTASARGIDNTPTPAVKVALTQLINKVLDPLRSEWKKPITVNSGYRSPMLNKIVGGVGSSQHVLGQAADITTGSPEENKVLMALAVTLRLPYDQVIDEHDYEWIHISYGPRNRRQILHIR